MKYVYDAYGMENPPCGINTTYNAKRVCELEFTATEDMEPPILVHYELTNFHQNHKNYYQYRDLFQLLGRPSTEQTSLEEYLCEPLNKLGDVYLNPCGLIANTFFNDIYSVTSGNDVDGAPLELIEKGIAWESDLQYKFSQPNGFEFELCDNAQPSGNGTCDETCCSAMTRTEEGLSWSCEAPAIDPEDGLCYRYHYPDEETTQYLYETYPDKINPLEGVTNEHFVVWMRVATLPTFRKLYGYFDQAIEKGQTFTIQVESNYVVESFHGSKAVIVSTNNIFGGKNPVLGQSFIVVGFFSLAAAVFFSLKHWLRPRKLADRKYLHYKED